MNWTQTTEGAGWGPRDLPSKFGGAPPDTARVPFNKTWGVEAAAPEPARKLYTPPPVPQRTEQVLLQEVLTSELNSGGPRSAGASFPMPAESVSLGGF